MLRDKPTTPTETKEAMTRLIKSLVNPSNIPQLRTISDIETVVSDNLRSNNPDPLLCAMLCDKAAEVHQKLFQEYMQFANTETLSVFADGGNFHRNLAGALRKIESGEILERADLWHLDPTTERILLNLASSAKRAVRS